MMAHKSQATMRAMSEPVVFIFFFVTLIHAPTSLDPIAPTPSTSSVLLSTTLETIDEPHPKRVHIFITPSLEPPLVTSLLDFPPLS